MESSPGAIRTAGPYLPWNSTVFLAYVPRSTWVVLDTGIGRHHSGPGYPRSGCRRRL
ncbi:hypothetical protein IMZ48_47820 [Candidatus Bathyarchaeota archaeon]|nr:hypothetical protein [Candidatus Bathyarchaeota archaeon]